MSTITLTTRCTCLPHRYKYVAGIRPGPLTETSPTLWDSVLIAPTLHLTGLSSLNCSFLSPRGLISLEYKTNPATGRIFLEVYLPPGVPGTLRLPGRVLPLMGGERMGVEV